MTQQKTIILTARIISLIFTPFYLPLVGQAALFTFSYMKELPWQYKLYVMLTTYLFTVLLPTLLIRLYRRMRGWTRAQSGLKHRRFVPYAISIASYGICLKVLEHNNIFHFICTIVLAALAVQVACVLLNVFWKVSTHTAAIGGVAGGLLAFAELFHYNPVWWLSIVLLLAGVLGSARMLLRQHSLAQVVMGFWVGFFAAGASILYL